MNDGNRGRDYSNEEDVCVCGVRRARRSPAERDINKFLMATIPQIYLQITSTASGST